MPLLKPDLYLTRITSLDAAFMAERGLEGLLLDVDGTLKEFRAEVFPDETLDWISSLKESGIKLCLVSNGGSARIGKLAGQLDLPFAAKAFKPLPFACRGALRRMSLTADRVAIAGDQVFADVMAGQLSGLYTILVKPLSLDEPWFTRLKRPLESLALRRYGLRPIGSSLATESPAR